MTLLVAAYLAGALTIVSPCILPVLPFVLARAGRPFLGGTLPFLAGLAAAFAGAATLAAVGGGWIVRVSEAGRLAALGLLGLFAVTLLSRRAAARLSAPLVRLGETIARIAGRGAPAGLVSSLCLGAATGLLWTPCAGPILGLVLTAAALNGPGPETVLLLAAYAAGAASSLALAVGIGGTLAAALRRRLGLGEQIRRIAGAVMLAALAGIALGLDAEVLAPLATARTIAAEETIAATLRLDATRAEPATGPYRSRLPVEGRLPNLDGAVHWLNGGPPSAEQLRGKVRLVHVWTSSCINCIRTLPYIRAWEARYREQGLAVIGVHAPEFAFERDIDTVARAVRRFAIRYPVALDNDFRIWRALRNTYWPALYIVDTDGRIRHHQFGEGGYLQAEAVIRDLLAEAAGRPAADGAVTTPLADGAETAPDLAQLRSAETYLGLDKAENFVSPEGLAGGTRTYSPAMPRLNAWSLSGTWEIGPEHARLGRAGGGIAYRFRARDLHLVLGPGAGPVRFRVTLDGRPPGADHGADIAPDGEGVATEKRLYQLVRQSGVAAERTFEIRFQDPGVRAYAFTFG